MNISKNIFDVIVVGAGPAGSTTSYLLSKGGMRVLLIDKSTFPREKLCGGFLTEKAVRLVERVFDESRQTLEDKGIIDFVSKKYSILYRSRVLISGDSDIPCRFVNRSDFDTFLLEKARNSGTHIVEGELVDTCDASNCIVQTHSGREYKGRIIVGADGVSSIIRRSLPEGCYDSDHWRNRLAVGLELSVSAGEFPGPVDHPMIYFGYIKNGYSWVFPRTDHVVVGMGGINSKNSGGIKTCFRTFCISLGLSDAVVNRYQSYPIPFGNYLERPGYNSILLIGDAAGLADAIFGEGLYYAIKSGALAAEAILRGNREEQGALELYSYSMNQHIFPDLAHLNKRGDQLYWLLRFLGYIGVWLYVLWKGKKMINRIHYLRSDVGKRRKI